MLMLVGPLPPWARFVAAGVISVAVVWVLAGQTLIRNRHKLDALWCSRALTIIACVVALSAFFSRLYGSELKPFYGYYIFTPEQAPMMGYTTMGAVVTVIVLALTARAGRTGLLLAALEALLGAFGGSLWVPLILRYRLTLAYGTYLLEIGFACVVVASLWQFKELADRMPAPQEPAPAGDGEDRPTV